MPSDGYTVNDLGDLLALTQTRVEKGRITQIAQSLTKYTAANELFTKNRVKVEAGTHGTFKLMTELTRNSRWVGLYAPDNLNQSDTVRTGQMELRHLTTGFIWDKREVDFNKGERQIVDLYKVRRLDMMIGNVEEFENRFWTLTDATDDKTVYGTVPYFVVKSATPQFTSTLPTSYTTVANLSPTTITRWRNWGDAYTDVTESDLIAKMITAHYQTDWQPAVTGIIPDFAQGSDTGIYTNLTVITQLEQFARTQNDNLGSELAKYMGRVTFRGTPVHYVPRLNADTTNPVYGLFWPHWRNHIHKDWWMKETIIKDRPDAHTTCSQHLDWTLTPVCYDRSTQWVISNGTTDFTL